MCTVPTSGPHTQPRPAHRSQSSQRLSQLRELRESELSEQEGKSNAVVVVVDEKMREWEYGGVACWSRTAYGLTVPASSLAIVTIARVASMPSIPTCSTLLQPPVLEGYLLPASHRNMSLVIPFGIVIAVFASDSSDRLG
jgi:hypothetical protein